MMTEFFTLQPRRGFGFGQFDPSKRSQVSHRFRWLDQEKKRFSRLCGGDKDKYLADKDAPICPECLAIMTDMRKLNCD